MFESINALIVDDEHDAREGLQFLIEKYCSNVKILAKADSVNSAKEILAVEEIEAIFLDITMPHESGFDLLEQVDPKKYMFVFVTAYDQYALRALKASAVDFLQKPIAVDDLINSADKLLEQKKLRLSSENAVNVYKESLESLVSNTHQRKGVHRLCLPGIQGFNVIDVSNILYLMAEGNYTIFHMVNNKKIVVSKPIKDYEELLDPTIFFRNHKSSIINLKFLIEFLKVDGYYAVMADSNSISVSRRKLPDFLKAVEEYNSKQIS
jgi:two-component system, LytTR family, response regulator